ncbi:hypothetical protein AB6A23_26175 [Paenibacillus tarimensis]
MNPKKLIIAGTLAFVISVSGNTWNDNASAEAGSYFPDSYKTARPDKNDPVEDKFLETLGVRSDEEVYDALYSGQSLADIAADHQADVQRMIDLQVAQLTEQLDKRFAKGSLNWAEYKAQITELPGIVAASVYKQYQ